MEDQITRKPMGRVDIDEDDLLTPEEVGKKLKIHPSQARRMFANEDGVIDIGLGTKYATIRIPKSVFVRVLRRRAAVKKGA